MIYNIYNYVKAKIGCTLTVQGINEDQVDLIEFAS